MDTEERGIKDLMKSQSSDHPEPEKAGPGKGERKLNALDDLDADGIVMLARRHYATGFPNPQRRGCPPSGEIVKVVGRGRAPEPSLRAHLFECSECFVEYRQTLAQYRDEVAGRKRLIPIFTLKRVSAAAVILLALFSGGRLIWRQPAPEARNDQIAHSTPSEAPSEARIGRGGETTPSQIAQRRSAEVAALSVKRRATGKVARSSSVSELITMNVDLDDYQALRESQGEKPPGEPDERSPGERAPVEEIIQLPAARARLVLRLPETGAAGHYTVNLVDAFDQVLLSRHAVSHDGAKLRVTLDLRRIAPEKYRLRLSREGEAPAYYDVIIKKR